MPQLNKGGKSVFGKSFIHEDRTIQLPEQAISFPTCPGCGIMRSKRGRS